MNDKTSLVKDASGFQTVEIPSYLLNEHYDDRYFDVVNAVEEAKHIFFQGCGIMDIISSKGPAHKVLRVGETGFGAGRVLIALMDFLERGGAADIDITYNSVELHPVSPKKMLSILDGFRPDVGPLIDLLAEKYSGIDTESPGWKKIILDRPFGNLTLNLWIGEALEMVNALEVPCDAWFLDGHGPKKNPEIWRHELLMAIGRKTRPGGTCATYTVASAVRRGLMDAGFLVEQRPGFGGKKAALRGVKLY